MARFIPTNDADITKVDASPTKAFFVDIITRDIQVDEAILDLIDNSIDGAKRLRPGDDPDFSGLRVDIIVNEANFSISDNCGGIPLDIARKYAFKFGRAPGFSTTDRSVGQFGVGMKRALFKMAQSFKVETVAQDHSFKINVDVGTWTADDVNWDFDLSDLRKGPFAPDVTGTTLSVENLVPEVAETLGAPNFASNLSRDVRVRHQFAMSRNLAISINGETLLASNLKLKVGTVVYPMARRYEDPIRSSTLVTRIYAGVEESQRVAAGWYVFCNGRCILEADQSSLTGWSQVTEAGVSVPKYHGQFARFRGFAFLDAIDASILPWNTTKTSLDPETPAYRLLLPRLITATRPIIDFLNALDSEIELPVGEQVLTEGLRQSTNMALASLPARDTFIFQEPPERGPPMSTIKYRRPTSEANRLKVALGAPTLPILGDRSFQFALDNLVEDEE